MHAQNRITRQRDRAGLTLMELVVVMTILVALAGILVPLLPGLFTRSAIATNSTNVPEIGKAIGVYQQMYLQFPNNWDALTDASGNVIDYFANGSACPAADWTGGTENPGNGEITQLTLTANEVTALVGVGITQVQAMVKTVPSSIGNFDPTFNYYPDEQSGGTANPAGNAISVAGVTYLAGLDPTSGSGPAYKRCIALNLPTTGRYVCLGLGPRNSMISKTVQVPPVHVGDQPVLNPEYGYQRFVAVFKVSDTAVGSNFTQAELVAVVSVKDDGLGQVDNVKEFYKLSNGAT